MTTLSDCDGITPFDGIYFETIRPNPILFDSCETTALNIEGARLPTTGNKTTRHTPTGHLKAGVGILPGIFSSNRNDF